MTAENLAPATKRTLYFIGVTTSTSSIINVFPAWANYLELGDVDTDGLPREHRGAVRHGLAVRAGEA